jgi:hypothetical protein
MTITHMPHSEEITQRWTATTINDGRDAAGGVMNDVSAARLLAMIEAEQADGWTDFRIVGHLMGYLAERAAITGNDAA